MVIHLLDHDQLGHELGRELGHPLGRDLKPGFNLTVSLATSLAATVARSHRLGQRPYLGHPIPGPSSSPVVPVGAVAVPRWRCVVPALAQGLVVPVAETTVLRRRRRCRATCRPTDRHRIDRAQSQRGLRGTPSGRDGRAPGGQKDDGRPRQDRATTRASRPEGARRRDERPAPMGASCCMCGTRKHSSVPDLQAPTTRPTSSLGSYPS